MPLIHEFAGRLGAALFLLTLLAAPWLYGGVTPYGKIVLCAGLLLTGITAFLRFVTANRFLNQNVLPERLFLTATPLVLLILFGILQISPFPERTMKVLSPGILELNAKLLPAPGSDEDRLDQMIMDAPLRSFPPVFTMSVYPKATREFIVFLTMGLIAFLSAGILFPTPNLKRLLWTMIVLNGIALALFMIFTQTMPDAEFYRKIWPGAHCGPYVNKNNAAGYLCLCLGPAVALFALSIRLHAHDDHLTGVFADGVNRHLRKIKITDQLILGTHRFFDFSNRFALFGLAAIGILIAATAVSLSRGGTLGGIFALLLVLCVLLSRKRLGFLLIPLWGTLLLALFLIGQLGLSEPVQQRMGTLLELEPEMNAAVQDGRPVNWNAALQTNSSVYHGRGSGLGTYSAAIRGNDIATKNDGIFEHAENQFVETVLTAGIPGIVLLLLFLAIFWTIAVLSILRSPEEDWNVTSENDAWRLNLPFATGLGLTALLGGQTVAASFDFGLCLSANFILLSALCGSFGSGFIVPAVPSLLSQKGKWGRRFMGSALCGLLLLSLTAGVFGFRELQKNRKVETALDEARLDPSPQKLRLDSIDWKIAQLDKAKKEVPDDIRIPYQTALLRIARYRFLALETVRKGDPDAEIQHAWNLTDPILLHSRIEMFEKNGMKVWPKHFRSNPAVLENLLPAERDAITARKIAPIFPDPHILYGVLLPLVSDSPQNPLFVDRSIQRAAESVRYETRILYLCGVLEFAAGQKEKACEYWRRSIALTPKYFRSILSCVMRESNPDLLRDQLKNLIGDDFALLEETAAAYPKKTHPIPFEAVLRLMDEVLSQARNKESGEYYRNRARFDALSGRPDESEKNYREALKIEPRQARWCYECAMMLAQHNELDRSVSMLERALEIEPRRQTYQKTLSLMKERKQQLLFNQFPDTEPKTDRSPSAFGL